MFPGSRPAWRMSESGGEMVTVPNETLMRGYLTQLQRQYCWR